MLPRSHTEGKKLATKRENTKLQKRCKAAKTQPNGTDKAKYAPSIMHLSIAVINSGKPVTHAKTISKEIVSNSMDLPRQNAIVYL